MLNIVLLFFIKVLHLITTLQCNRHASSPLSSSAKVSSSKPNSSSNKQDYPYPYYIHPNNKLVNILVQARWKVMDIMFVFWVIGWYHSFINWSSLIWEFCSVFFFNYNWFVQNLLILVTVEEEKWQYGHITCKQLGEMHV
jgi:hypothetical protein